MKETTCIIVVGNPIDGYKFFGPFDSYDDADVWAEGPHEGKLQEFFDCKESWICPLTPPAPED